MKHRETLQKAITEQLRREIWNRFLLGKEDMTDIGKSIGKSRQVIGYHIHKCMEELHSMNLTDAENILAWARKERLDIVFNMVRFTDAMLGNSELEVKWKPMGPEEQRMREFFRFLNMPLTLRSIGIDSSDAFDAMARRACGNGTVGGLKALSAEDVRQIYENAF